MMLLQTVLAMSCLLGFEVAYGTGLVCDSSTSCQKTTVLCRSFPCTPDEEPDNEEKRSLVPKDLQLMFNRFQRQRQHIQPLRPRRLGSEFLGKRSLEFLGKRSSEFLGKRSSEFLGKRSMEDEPEGYYQADICTGKRANEMLGKRAEGEDGDPENINYVNPLWCRWSLLAERSPRAAPPRRTYPSEFLGKRSEPEQPSNQEKLTGQSEVPTYAFSLP